MPYHSTYTYPGRASGLVHHMGSTFYRRVINSLIEQLQILSQCCTNLDLVGSRAGEGGDSMEGRGIKN